MFRKFPNALVIMIYFIIFCGICSYIIPKGQYERAIDPETNFETVVQGSYRVIEGEPLSIYTLFLSIPEGIIGRADLVVLVLLFGGCFYVIEKTGALKEGISFLTNKLQGKEELALIIVAAIFSTLGSLSGFQEEIIALTPLLLFFTRTLGYNACVAIAISHGAAVVGCSFGPLNPFGVGIAQSLVNLPYLSALGFRIVALVLGFILWMTIIIRYGNKNRITRETEPEKVVTRLHTRHAVILGLVVLGFAIMMVGLLKFDWGFNEMSAEFFVLGIIIGIIGKLGVNGTSTAYIEGFKEMTFAAIIIGLANSISIVLQKGMIIDSIIYGLFQPLQYLPSSISAVAMMGSQAILHFPIPSSSGQAILTMPILAPLSDLIGLSRQVCVLAYQYGAILMDFLVPTNGALMAIIAIAGISYDEWFKFAIKPLLIMFVFCAIVIMTAIHLGV